MTILVKIGYGTTIRFKSQAEAWMFINDMFTADFNAENPEDMSIEVEFRKERGGNKDEGNTL